MSTAPRAPLQVGVLVFDQVEVLDFAGPYEVFAGLRDGERPLCQVHVLAATPEVTCRGGLRVRADALLDAPPPLDLVIVPGGPGVRAGAEATAPLVAYVRRAAEAVPVVASVCTGAFLLAEAGLLHGRRAATHHSARERLAREFPRIEVTDRRVVDEGVVLSASGVASGIDLALYLVGRLIGPEAANERARQIEVPWTHPGDVLVGGSAAAAQTSAAGAGRGHPHPRGKR